MSQNEYKVKLVVDDTALKQLSATMNSIFNTGAKKSSGSSESNSPIKSLLKLGAIATGIGTLVMGVKKLVDFTVDSSPMLKAMLQLFNNSLMFIFRPIGDFFGFILRPIALQLLRFAIPFYKALEPFAQRYGTQIGNLISGLLALMMDPSALLKGLVINVGAGIGNLTSGISTAAGNAASFISSTLTSDMTSITSFFTKVSGNISSLITPAWSLFVELFDSVKTGVSVILKGWDSFYGIFTTLSNTVSSIITPAWNIFSSLFSSIGSVIDGTILKGWDMFYGFFSNLGTSLKPVSEAAASFIKFFVSLGTSLSNFINPALNAFTSFWKAVQDFIKGIMNFLQNPFGSVGSSASSSASSAGSSIASAGTYIENLTVSGLQVASSDLNDFFKNPSEYIRKVGQQSQVKMPRS